MLQVRKRCSKFARQAFHQFAFCSITQSPFARAYYNKKRKEGKDAHHAIRCLANVGVKFTLEFLNRGILFAMWRDHKPYDEQKHLAMITLQAFSANEA